MTEGGADLSSEETGDRGVDLLDEEERRLLKEFEQIWSLERHQQQKRKRGWPSLARHVELDIDDVKKFLYLVIFITLMIVLSYITMLYVYSLF